MRRLALGIMIASACGGGGPGEAPLDAPGLPAIDAPEAGPAPEGRIELLEDLFAFQSDGDPTELASARVDVEFFDGPAPRFHREAMRAGDCVLETYEPTQCTPACSGALCVDGACVRFPDLVSGGRVDVDGLHVPVSIEPRQDFYYLDTPPPADLFADDATITAHVAGAVVPAATLTGAGLPAIRTTVLTANRLAIPYPAATPLVIPWTPSGATGARVRLLISGGNRAHGAPVTARIVCETDDAAGELVVAPALLDAFPSSATFSCVGADCPPSSLRRYRRTTVTAGAHQLALEIASSYTFEIDHLVE